MSTDDWMRPDDWKKLSARLMAEHEHWRACINRLYYACFYAVGALLASKALSSKTHSGTRSLFAQHFVKPGLISKDHADFYGMLFDQRQRGDRRLLRRGFRSSPPLAAPRRSLCRGHRPADRETL